MSKKAFPGTRKVKAKQLPLFSLGFVAKTERERQREEVRQFTEKMKDPDKKKYLLADGDYASVKCPSCDHIGAKVTNAYGDGMFVECAHCGYKWRTERDKVEASQHDAQGSEAPIG